MSTNGRFPPTALPSLYQGVRRYNLSESTTKDLRLGQLIDFLGIEAVRDLRLGYTDPTEGLPELRQEIGKRFGVAADWVVVTQGAAFALYLVASELETGEAIIIAPYFQQAYNTLQAHGWQVCVVQNEFEQNYALNLAGIVDALSPQTRLVSLASPQNPSGVSVPFAILQELVEIMADKAPNAYLLVDETYREAAYTAEKIIPSVATLSPRVLTCSSVSKAYGAPDLRVGWLTLPDANFRQRVIDAKQNIVICDSGVTQQLALGLLLNGEAILTQQRAHMAAALAKVAQWQASEQERLAWALPDAGALCCMRLRADSFADDDLPKFWQALVESETFVRPGLLFGSDSRHFRLGFGHVSDEELAMGLSNISAALDAAQGVLVD